MVTQEFYGAIGARIREFRVSLNLTQVEFARSAKVKRQSVSAWEHGTSMPSCKTWLRLYRMGMSLDYAAGGVRMVPASSYATVPMAKLLVRSPEDVASGTRERQRAS